LEHTLRQNRRIVNNTFFSPCGTIYRIGGRCSHGCPCCPLSWHRAVWRICFYQGNCFVVGPLISFALPRIMIRDISINKACAANLVTSGLFLNIVVGIIIWCFASIVSNYIFEASNYSSQALNVAILGNIF